jgi:hypothetical protein
MKMKNILLGALAVAAMAVAAGCRPAEEPVPAVDPNANPHLQHQGVEATPAPAAPQ